MIEIELLSRLLGCVKLFSYSVLVIRSGSDSLSKNCCVLLIVSVVIAVYPKVISISNFVWCFLCSSTSSIESGADDEDSSADITKTSERDARTTFDWESK